MNERSSAVLKLSAAGKQIVRIIMVSALLVTAARILAPLEVGKDQGTQLEAAQRLAHGLSLTTTADILPSSFDITSAPQAKPLTWFAPGFSVIVAAFLALGLPLFVSLKAIYSAVTLAGWAGWSVLAGVFLANPIRFRSTGYPIHWIMAALIPVWFTPSWSGTDIFLWAAVPALVLLMRRAAESRGAAAAVTAGFIFGAACAIRYAGAFAAPAALLILLQAAFPDIDLFLKRSAVFLAAALIVVAPVAAFILTSPGEGETPVTGIYEHPIESAEAGNILFFAQYASPLIFGHSLPTSVVASLPVKPLPYIAGGVFLVIVLLAPFVLWKWYGLHNNLLLMLSLLPFSLAVFLIVVSRGWLLGIPRYYQPVALCGVFIWYVIASAKAGNRIAIHLARAIVAGFLFYICVYMPAFLLTPSKRLVLSKIVLDFMPSNPGVRQTTSETVTYPQYDKLYSRKESSRAKLRELYRSYPEALYFTDSYPFYIFDGMQGGPRPGEQLRDLPPENYWQRARMTTPAKIFWIVDTESAVQFVPLSYRKKIHSDPVEGTVIFESDFPAGYQFASALK
jgi:hypothetical protein